MKKPKQTNKKAPTHFTEFINTGIFSSCTSVSYGDLEAMLRAIFFLTCILLVYVDILGTG